MAALTLNPVGRFVPTSQRGAALVVGLLFLMLMTMIATVAMRQSITQERMAGGMRNTSLSRSGAESALRAAEGRVFTYYLNSNGRVLVGDKWASQGVHPYHGGPTADVSDFRNRVSYAAGTGYPLTFANLADPSAVGTGALAVQPAFIMDDMGKVRPPGVGTEGEGGSTGKENYEGSGGGSPAGNSDVRIYRITGRSTGATTNIDRLVESTYAGRAKG